MTEKELVSIITSIQYHTGRFKGEAESNPVIRRKNGSGVVLSHHYAEELLGDMIKWANVLASAIPDREVQMEDL